MDDRLRQIAINEYPIYDGSQYGIPKDCAIKRMWKVQQQERRLIELRQEFIDHLARMPKDGMNLEELKQYTELFFHKYESTAVHT